MEAGCVPWPTGTTGVAGVEEEVVEEEVVEEEVVGVESEVAVFVAGEAGSIGSTGDVVDGALVTATFEGFATLGDAFFFVVFFVLLVVFVFVLAGLGAIFAALFVALFVALFGLLFVAVVKATALASMGSSTGTLP